MVLMDYNKYVYDDDKIYNISIIIKTWERK